MALKFRVFRRAHTASAPPRCKNPSLRALSFGRLYRVMGFKTRNMGTMMWTDIIFGPEVEFVTGMM